MISKTQFITLIEGMKKQVEFDRKFNSCFSQLNSSYTVVELSKDLDNAIFKVIEEDFTGTASDILCNYLYMDEKSFEVTIDFYDYDFEINEVGDLYDVFVEYFSNNPTNK